MIKPVKCTSAPQFIVGHFKLKMCATNINNFGLSKKLFKRLCRERMKFPIVFLMWIFGFKKMTCSAAQGCKIALELEIY